MKKSTFHNYYFDKFMYQALSGFSDKHEFMAQASLEEKLALLSDMGYPHTIVVASPQKKYMTHHQIARMVSILFKSISWKVSQAKKVLRGKNFFVLSDYDFIRGLRLASNMLNTPTMQGMALKTEPIFTYTHQVQKSAMRDAGASHDIDGIILKAFNLVNMQDMERRFVNDYNLTGQQYAILALLSKHKQCTETELRGMMQRTILSHHTVPLLYKRFIDKKIQTGTIDGGGKTQDTYFITGLGEQQLITARNYFIKHIL